jgi:hypothetical protein
MRNRLLVWPLIAGLLLVSSFEVAQASVSESIYYTESITNDFGLDIPPGVTLDVELSATISGTVTIRDPDWNVVETIDVSGPESSAHDTDIELTEAGTYHVSESYHLEFTGTPVIGEPKTITDDVLNEWTFPNPLPATGTFRVSSHITLSVADHTSNISVTLSGDVMDEPTASVTANVETIAPIPPGSTASARLKVIWNVETWLEDLTPQIGTIEVHTNLSEATFNLSGRANYSGSGESWTEPEAPVGTYTIIYGDVDGYEKPPSETKTLVVDGVITFTGEYIPVAVIPLAEGWNLISLPLSPIDKGVTLVMSSVSAKYQAVWMYDPGTRSWLWYIQNLPSPLNSLENMDAGPGYWVYMSEAGGLLIKGWPPSTDPIPLDDEWNLVGYNCSTPQDAASMLPSECEIMWTYDAGAKSWRRYPFNGAVPLNRLELLQPGQGYWIYANEYCEWRCW